MKTDWEKKRTQNWTLEHSSAVGQEIEKLAKKTRRGVTCEVAGDPEECEWCPGSQVKEVFQGRECDQRVKWNNAHRSSKQGEE